MVNTTWRHARKCYAQFRSIYGAAAARFISELLFWHRNKISERRSVGSPSMTNKAKQALVVSTLVGSGARLQHRGHRWSLASTLAMVLRRDVKERKEAFIALTGNK